MATPCLYPHPGSVTQEIKHCSQANACTIEKFDPLLLPSGVRSDTFVSKSWTVLCLPFADLEQRDLKFDMFALWRLMVSRLLCVKACQEDIQR